MTTSAPQLLGVFEELTEDNCSSYHLEAVSYDRNKLEILIEQRISAYNYFSDLSCKFAKFCETWPRFEFDKESPVRKKIIGPPPKTKEEHELRRRVREEYDQLSKIWQREYSNAREDYDDVRFAAFMAAYDLFVSCFQEKIERRFFSSSYMHPPYFIIRPVEVL